MAKKAVSTTGGQSASASSPIKLLIGAAGIYGAFLYYGLLQEDVLTYTSPDGVKFTMAWFLQVLEAAANVVIGFGGRALLGGTAGLPMQPYALSGATQVLAKYCTSASTIYGLAYPVATLAKSAKMVPVMAGSLLIGKATYTMREYAQVAMIVAGTAMVALAKKKGGGGSSVLGVAFIVASLVFDGITGGVQQRLKTEIASAGKKQMPYDIMTFTNLFMMLTALAFALVRGELFSGMGFLTANPEIMSKIIKFSLCSAIGQSFIFFTIANFGPLACTTVTTTRKVFTVLLSIVTKGHSMNAQGWAGIALASAGILAEMQEKLARKPKSEGSKK